MLGNAPLDGSQYYDDKWGYYYIRLSKDDIQKLQGLLKDLFRKAYEEAMK